jgi:hypothetical protein
LIGAKKPVLGRAFLTADQEVIPAIQNAKFYAFAVFLDHSLFF